MNVDIKFTEAAEACNKHDFKTAKSILKEIILVNKHSESYRLLGQIAYEENKDDLAMDYLIEALKIDPKNMWGLIMMGNLYSKRKGDIETARTYIDKVLEYYPNNPIALNNLAAILMEVQQYDEAIEMFSKVIELDPTYPNCYYGQAMAYMEKKDYSGAFASALHGAKVAIDRPENKSVRTELLKMMMYASKECIKMTNYMHVVLGIKDELSLASPQPIDFYNDNTLKVYAKLEYAPYHHADRHIVRYNGKMENYEHLMIHEMGHLRMQLAASKAGTGKVMVRTNQSDAAFNRRYGQILRKQLKGKMDNQNMAAIIRQVQEGICLQLMNCPLDLFVERYIYEHYPVMHPLQLQMLLHQEQDNVQGVQSGETARDFPPAIVKANKIMNLCTSMQFLDLYGINNVANFKPTKAEYDQAKDLYDEFLSYWNAADLKPGEEYDLVEYFLSSFDMEELIEIVPEADFEQTLSKPLDPVSVATGDYDIYTEEEKERQRTFEENSKKPDAARDMMMTMYILAALEEYSAMRKPQVKKIAMEFAMLGMNGIDPSKQSGYRIPSMDKDFGGYLLLAYEYTAWKLTIPETAEQLGLPYRDQYEAA